MNSNQNVLNYVYEWLSNNEHVLLVTVMKTWGSSPRPVGSLMAVRSCGTYVGSVSGGCIEDDIIKKYLNNSLSKDTVSTLTYGIDREQAHRHRLPCGGVVVVALEKLNDIQTIKPVVDALEQNNVIMRQLDMMTSQCSFKDVDEYQESSFDNRYLSVVFGAQWTIIIIGANDLSRHVTEMALSLDYRVIVCDPREFIDDSWLDDRVEFSQQMPDQLIADCQSVGRTIVLALSHEPRLDGITLVQALGMNFFYVGAIGSRKTQNKRKKLLNKCGLSEADIEKLHGPVGLDLASKLPMEIAIAVVAEIIMLRRKRVAFDS